MKKFTLSFFIAVSIVYGIGAGFWAYELISALRTGGTFVGEAWTFLAVAAIWLKLLDLSALAVVETPLRYRTGISYGTFFDR